MGMTLPRYSEYREGETVMGPLKDKTILVVADDANMRDLLLRVLEEAGADVVTADSVEAAFETTGSLRLMRL